MHFEPQFWAWPQWTLAIMLVVGLAISAALHGKPKVDSDKKPQEWNFPLSLVRFGLWMFILIAGGFFGGVA